MIGNSVQQESDAPGLTTLGVHCGRLSGLVEETKTDAWIRWRTDASGTDDSKRRPTEKSGLGHPCCG